MAQEKAEAKFSGLDDLFAASIDEIADLPSFETPPRGQYVLRCTFDVKEINNKDAVEMAFEVVETVELADKEATPVAPGTKFSTAFILGNAVSEGKLKEALLPYSQKFNEKNIGTLVRDIVKDILISATVTNRKDKDDPDKIYGGVKNVIIA